MRRIAIIGTGISGLSAAYLLHHDYDITVYEKAADIGGHTRTRTVRYRDKDIAVDTGFIVFNYRNYPNLSALFKHLNVPVEKSVMSFGVTAAKDDLEWSAESPNALFGQRRNFLRPAFYRFLLDVVRFNSQAEKAAMRWPDLTMGEFIKRLKLSEWFTRYYILPMGGAIWSCSLKSILGFPAKSFIAFFKAHGLLTVTQQPQWYTVTGGSQEYIHRLIAPFRDRIRSSCAVEQVLRQNEKIQLRDASGGAVEYDDVIFACHADEVLKILGDASAEETQALQPFSYQKNKAILHKNTRVMPKRKRCWASWIYHADAKTVETGEPISVTYWMNRLQSIDNNYPLFVTLNPQEPIAEADIFDQHEFEHPVYSKDAFTAQALLPSLQGQRNTWFCGAYHRNGFHEDGLASAVDVAKRLGVQVPWH